VDEGRVAQLSDDIIKAYRAARYGVEWTAGAFHLTIDEPNRRLAALFKHFGVNCAAYLTAWNPESQPTPAAANNAAQARLEAELDGWAIARIGGWGEDAADEWPAERSTLAIGLDRARAESLATAFRQNAFVWIGADIIPRLVLMR
jgi:hypothetical protein